MTKPNIQHFESVAEFTKAVRACLREHNCKQVSYELVIVHNPNIPMYTIKKAGIIRADSILKNGKLPHYTRDFFGMHLLVYPDVIITPL